MRTALNRIRMNAYKTNKGSEAGCKISMSSAYALINEWLPNATSHNIKHYITRHTHTTCRRRNHHPAGCRYLHKFPNAVASTAQCHPNNVRHYCTQHPVHDITVARTLPLRVAANTVTTMGSATTRLGGAAASKHSMSCPTWAMPAHAYALGTFTANGSIHLHNADHQRHMLLGVALLPAAAVCL